ncbi:DNA-deoxyinosine glycosylase [Nitrogeniibacter mangrovi]|uniref:DNA-deoxyinosine glycosylase n=1 Tax=Nitrogeniibacter mangrovi TaxID=2016596 RepID=A0A6C1B3R1_9RHOO|nr:DNA-deoxyinosine glycosylase [Nitrogeniibacter mangrovi]QID18301.1 DNA-deoxyinosine glycosylase [Nitrogeniibacter mangrovi]
MSTVRSFPPLAAPDATRLILGSMPGRRSLAQVQYYAHPHNAFWKIMGDLLGFDPQTAYERRCEALGAARVALWDVMATCIRPSSLDADIVEDSIVPNDLAGFLTGHPQIGAIYFNGAKAEHSFLRHVLPALNDTQRTIPRHRLPSTSPAHAGMRFEDKLARWREALTAGSAG